MEEIEVFIHHPSFGRGVEMKHHFNLDGKTLVITKGEETISNKKLSEQEVEDIKAFFQKYDHEKKERFVPSFGAPLYRVLLDQELKKIGVAKITNDDFRLLTEFIDKYK